MTGDSKKNSCVFTFTLVVIRQYYGNRDNTYQLKKHDLFQTLSILVRIISKVDGGAVSELKYVFDVDKYILQLPHVS